MSSVRKKTKGYFEQPEVWSKPVGQLTLAALMSSASGHGKVMSRRLFDQLAKRTEKATETVLTFLIEDYNRLLEYLEEHPVDVMVPTKIEEEIRK